MRVSELQQHLSQADPAAVLVAPRVLERIIQQTWALPRLRWSVPHSASFVVDRAVLFRFVEQADLDLDPSHLLPPKLLLLARPQVDELGRFEHAEVLQKYWSRLFHAAVHREIEARRERGQLTDADVRQRVAAVGAAEFAEIRSVLQSDGLLPPNPDDRTVYVEFAAVYLEMRYFAPPLVQNYFPSLRDPEAIDRLLARDLDAAVLFNRTRLAGVADPVLRTDDSNDESHDYYWSLVRAADRASAGDVKNVVRAAILLTKAARVAPAAKVDGTRAAADAAIAGLTTRLQAALFLTESVAADWRRRLTALLEKADQGNAPVEAALLFDLQQVCLDAEKGVYALDLAEWGLSGGKRPVKRPLPSQRTVRIVKHLRAAALRLTRARLTDADREALAGLLRDALADAEHRLRDRFRPVLTDAILDTGLRPDDPPTEAALRKLVEQLLDRIAAHGYLTFGDLRDGLSRNQVKLPDLVEPNDLLRGDPLVRLDRRLGSLLDGVYRPSESYTRWLHQLTALFFGTVTGRWTTRFVLLPFGGALLGVELFKLAMDKVVGMHVPWQAEVGVWLAVGLFLQGMFHVPAFRNATLDACRAGMRGCWALGVALPTWLARVLRVPTLIGSWPVQMAWWFVIKPAVLFTLLFLLMPGLFGTTAGPPSLPAEVEAAAAETLSRWSPHVSAIALGFVACLFLVNSRLGRAAGDAVTQWAGVTYTLIRSGLLPSVVRAVSQFFKQLLHGLEWAFVSVDEFLRFRSGDSVPSMCVRALLGLLWYPVAYVVRFYTVVLIEPMLNPLKLPISMVAGKLLAPALLMATPHVLTAVSPVLGPWLGGLIVVSTMFLLPDAFGFLVWEMKENWGLYAANRPPVLKPVPLGPHGETMAGLLRPGFHSGAVPGLFTRLRAAAREACRSGNWRSARRYRQQLEEIEHAVLAFAARDLLDLLGRARCFAGVGLSVGHVSLASNRVRVELRHDGHADEPVVIEFEERCGRLLARVREAGWLGLLTPEQRRAFATALSGWYKLAGVDLVDEQLAANLPAECERFDVVPEGLALWGRDGGGPVVYRLRPRGGRLRPVGRGESRELPAGAVLYSYHPIGWDAWVEVWRGDREGPAHPSVSWMGGPVLPAGQATVADEEPPVLLRLERAEAAAGS